MYQAVFEGQYMTQYLVVNAHGLVHIALQKGHISSSVILHDYVLTHSLNIMCIAIMATLLICVYG